MSAVYNVEPYLAEFIASVEAQTFDLGRVEVIAVDDGSTDGSPAILADWAHRRPGLVRVLTKPNGGQASARNLGLEHATGEWVTFSDPDDMLDRGFLAAAARFAAAHRSVTAMAPRPVVLHERDEGAHTAAHPRDRQYLQGSRVVHVDREPQVFFGVSAGSLFRLDRIREAGLSFDPRVRPTFEDGHFAAHYLMAEDEPEVGVLRDATYVYRRRASGSSTQQRSLAHPGRYTDVFEFGYLDVLRAARDRYGSIPEWLQHLIVYELSWYLSEDEKSTTGTRLSPELVPRFHALLAEVMAQLDPAVVRRHAVRRLEPVWVDILSHAGRDEDWHSSVAVRTKVDRAMGLQRVSYRYAGRAPAERFLVDGRPVEPAYGKVMAHTYFRRPLLWERIAWLPASGRIEVALGGEVLEVVGSWRRAAEGSRVRRGRRTAWGRVRSWSGRVTERARAALVGLPAAAWRLAASTGPVRARFRDAWVVMDRIHDAGDNGERLFEYLQAERPDINAWFVLQKGTADWRRLQASGTRRVVAHGSVHWVLLMLNCAWLVSSHLDFVVERPARILGIAGRRSWKTAFLQHGVIKDDLSLWFNRHDVDLIVVSTEPELRSVVGDGTGYRYTTKEVRNTGLPRFDRLLAKGREVGPDGRDLVIVAPTWRTYLTRRVDGASQERAVDGAVHESEWYRLWVAVLRSEAIARAAAARGLRVAFMPHPNMQPVVDGMDLPGHVEPLTFLDNDAQALYARCALLVTDYSSVAFNTAYLDRPVVYFQFDREEMASGAHMGRQGYYDYERDGFGPVATSVEEAVAAIVEAIERGPCPAPEYQARIDRTFPARDGRACERVVAAIEELSRPWVPPA